MQLNYNRIDHTTLYRGSGYIVEDGNMLKTCATRSPTPPPNITITSYHDQKLKNDKHINPHLINDITNPSTPIITMYIVV